MQITKLKVALLSLSLFGISSGALADSPRTPSASELVPTAIEFYKQDRFHDAILYLQAALKRNPKDALAYYNLGLCQLALKENDNAIKSFNSALTINNTLTEAFEKRGACKDALRDKRGAIADYSHAISLESSPAPTLIYSRGLALFALGDFSRAASDFRQTLKDPKLNKAHYYLALCDAEAHDRNGSISELNTYIGETGGDSRCFVKRADMYVQLNQFPRAVHDYTEALRLEEDMPEALEKRSLVYSLMGKGAQALEDANNLIKSVRDKSHAYSTRAYAQYTLGDMRGAKGDCDACKSISEDDYLQHFVSALLQRKSHNDKIALAELTKSIELNASFSESFAERGELFCASDDYAAAEADFRKCLQLAPECARNITNLGIALLKQNKYEAALKSFDDALKIDPTLAEAYSYRGYLNLQLKNTTQAVTDCHQAIKLNPKLAKAHYYLGLALENSGETTLANVEFSEATKLDPRLAQNMVTR